MIPTWFAFVCLAGLWSQRRYEHGVLAVFIVSTAFGATAAAEVVLVGNAPLTPVMFLLPFLVFHVVSKLGFRVIAREFRPGSAGFWLLVYFCWAVFSSITMPIIFAGETLVFQNNRFDGLGVALVPLAHSTTNVTQTVYMGAGVIAFGTLAALMRHSERAVTTTIGALLALGVLNLVGAVIQLLEAYSGIPLGLALVRNANYSVTSGQTAAGLVRIHGFFTETSAFSGFSVPLLCAFLVLWAHGIRRAWMGPLAIVTFAALVLSTSTTAYVALVGSLTVLLLAVVLRSFVIRQRIAFGPLTGVLLAFLAIGCVVLMIEPRMIDFAQRLVFEMVFNKADSESGRERGDWALRAWNNFLETRGFGVGAGSSRGSGWVFVMLGNVGAPGALVMAVFLGVLFFQKPRVDDAVRIALSSAAKIAFFASLLALAISGTMIDWGLGVYVYAAIVVGVAGVSKGVRNGRVAVVAAGEKPRKCDAGEAIGLASVSRSH